MRCSAASLSPSKRITTIGVVFEGRARPKPSLYSTRTPSMVITSSAPSNLASALSRSTRVKFSPSAVFRCSSGVFTAVGSALSTADGSGRRLRISSRRAPAYMPSSKPGQRSLKNRCPLISPANGAFVSFSLALISEWPVRHIVGVPPCCRIHGASWRVHFTSKMISPPLRCRQDVLREQHDLPVGIDDLAVLGHHPETVAVAVEGQAEFGIGLAQAADQVLQILRVRGVRVVVREGAVDVAEQFDDVAAERAVQPRRDRAGHAVAAVDGDLHRPRQLHVADDARQVLLDDLGLLQFARLTGALEAAVLDPLAQRLDAVAVQRLAGDHHLQAVVLGGVVAAGDFDAGASAE